MKSMRYVRVSGVVLLSSALCGIVWTHLSEAKGAKGKVLGLKEVIAFTYSPSKGFDPKQLRSVTLLGPIGEKDWKYWQPRGVVTGIGQLWLGLLRTSVDKAVDVLVDRDYGGNPRPLMMIDEFGFDYGGDMDEKSAQILRQAKRRKPDLAFAVWEMRGPVPKVLADAYRDAADLVMMESYVGDKRQYWWIASQVWAARAYDILRKTIVVLGVGKGGNPGEDWAETPEELEQQIRFVRAIAPKSPGVGFFGGTPELLAHADAVCARFSHLPTKDTGLPADLLAVAKTFSARHANPTLAVSPDWVEPNYNENGSGALAQPATLRAYLMNLGDQDALNVTIHLRNPPDKGGDVFAEGAVPVIPKRSATVAVLTVTGAWHVWIGQWLEEVDAPGAEVQVFHR